MYNFRDAGTPLSEDQALMRKRVLHQAVTEPETFDMAYYEAERGCGTTRCIAGWAVYFERGWVHANDRWDPDGLKQAAISALGLTLVEYYGPGNWFDGLDLFYDEPGGLERLRKLAGE